MTWSVTYLVIQIVTGVIGGHIAAVVAREHSFGLFGHTVTGAVGGAFSGYFLQTLAATMVDVNGVPNKSDDVTQWMLEGLAGLVAGAALTLLVGLVKHSIEHHRATQGSGDQGGTSR